MPFPTAVIFLLVLCWTALAVLCIAVGLFLFAVRRYRAVAPYITLVFPAMYLGGAVGVWTNWRVNAPLNFTHYWASVASILLVFTTCFVGGTSLGGFLGYTLASHIAKHFEQSPENDVRVIQSMHLPDR